MHELFPSGEAWQGDNKISADLKRDWLERGFVKIPGVISAEMIERYNSTVAKVRAEIDDGKDAYGYGERIGQLHQKETSLLEVASNNTIRDFLRWALGDEPIVMGSLNFQKGTQQDAHIDAIFFWPEPNFAMAGAWVALEDINEDAGPLFYLPGSHKWPFRHSEDTSASRPDLAAERAAVRGGAEVGTLVARMGNAWIEDLLQQEVASGVTRQPISLKAGDVVIWHSFLAHGGMPRANPALSRKSVVFHYLGKSTKLFTFDQFMLNDRAEIPTQPPSPIELLMYGDLEYMSFNGFVTYPTSGAVIHPL